MERIILFAGLLVAIFVLPVATGQDEPNVTEPNSIEDSYSLLEQRLSSIEDRLDDTEKRLDRLERYRKKSVSDSDDESGKDELRTERCEKQLQDARDAIAILQSKLDTLPSPAKKPLEVQLDIARDKGRLLANKERRLSTIARLAGKYPDLGVDVIAARQDLAECQQQKKYVDSKKLRLTQQIRELKKSASSNNKPKKRTSSVTK